MEKRSLGETGVELELDEAAYPRDAVYGAAYTFIDRCYVHLDRAGADRLKVTLRCKAGAVDTKALGEELENELLGQAWRRQVLEDGRSLLESITNAALGGATAPPGLDDLLADAGADAFDDPLGIAMSWEEKYTKKKGAAEADEAAAPAADGREST